MEYVLLFILVICVGIYLTDRKGWNATAKRLSNIVRAHIESAKPVKKIEKKIERQALDTWTAEFEGKSLDTEPKHVIIKTWYAKVYNDICPSFKCKCGYTDWHVSVDAAARMSKKHVQEQNLAEKLLKRNGGTRAW